MSDWPGERIVLTGGAGFLRRFVQEELRSSSRLPARPRHDSVSDTAPQRQSPRAPSGLQDCPDGPAALTRTSMGRNTPCTRSW